MKIILSRKGFDSSEKYGKVASPILPHDFMVSLPIPSSVPGSVSYGAITGPVGPLGGLVEDLTHRDFTAQDTAHLDPDLNAAALAGRQKGWKPIFGQAEAAQSHLANQDVGKGDLFLFYGWFRRVELCNGHYRFVRGAPDLHVIFGWLQIGEIYEAGPAARSQAPLWACYHAHFANAWSQNRVYVASEDLDVRGVGQGLPGGGVFSRFLQERCLTAPGQSRSVWLLPSCFDSANFTYHSDRKRWVPRRGGYELRTVSKGQEFVIDSTGCQGVANWVTRLFTQPI